MCVVVDVNTLPLIFNDETKGHEEFQPLWNWIINKYAKLGSYASLLNELNKLNKVVYIPDDKVDEDVDKVKEMCDDSDFDDPHIVSLIRVSGCKIVSSKDETADKHIKFNKFYEGNTKRPKIYRHENHADDILVDKNFADCCKPKEILNKDQREPFL